MFSFFSSLKITKLHSALLVLWTCIVYFLFAYQTNRTDFIQVLTLYSLLFLSFGLLYNYSVFQFKTLLGVGLVFRFLLLIALPNLSDDFYRFIWDGRAFIQGINPYLILPENNPDIIQDGALLYKGMGQMNGSHYTCYPPLNQFAFGIPALLKNNSLLASTILMRLTLIIADLITIYYGVKLLKLFSIAPKKILLYFLNPFIILELTGNLHYEGMMLAFLSASLYYLFCQKNNLSAVLFAGAVSIKLIPLIFLPVFYKKLGLKKIIVYAMLVGLVNLLLFLPFLSQDLVTNFMSSIHLYFQNFEFNASIYYIVRAIGYQVKGYNIIQSVGSVTPFIVIAITLVLSLIPKNKHHKTLMTSMLWVICSYYFLSSIVHPWYITIPLFLSLFTRFRFPILWSFVIIFSYSAYTNASYQENLWWVSLEYTLLFFCLMMELFNWKIFSKFKT
ncbi:glycosyltransferase family 58 protein [Ochrovirga pacifica]|uniref:hypothetical protein n=1 Tax=Ochrovirga pacifica TaxID=1042376 RepID=UPI0002559AFE|nr:hypothetical protein [Ochrovirga pacifica]